MYHRSSLVVKIMIFNTTSSATVFLVFFLPLLLAATAVTGAVAGGCPLEEDVQSSARTAGQVA